MDVNKNIVVSSHVNASTTIEFMSDVLKYSAKGTPREVIGIVQVLSAFVKWISWKVVQILKIKKKTK